MRFALALLLLGCGGTPPPASAPAAAAAAAPASASAPASDPEAAAQLDGYAENVDRMEREWAAAWRMLDGAREDPFDQGATMSLQAEIQGFQYALHEARERIAAARELVARGEPLSDDVREGIVEKIGLMQRNLQVVQGRAQQTPSGVSGGGLQGLDEPDQSGTGINPNDRNSR